MNETIETRDFDIRTGIKAGDGSQIGSGSATGDNGQMGSGSKTNGQFGSGG